MLVSLTPFSLLATTRTWTGAVNGSWSNAANWDGAVPVAGDDLVFSAAGSNKNTSNDLPAGTQFHSIAFTGGSYNVGGNAIAIGSGGISNSAPSASMSLPIRLASSQTWSLIAGSLFVNGGLPKIDLAGQTLTVDSEVAGNSGMTFVGGSGTIVKVGNGDWSIGGNNDFSGQVLINAGTLKASGATSLGIADNTLANGTIVNAGGTLNTQGNFAPEYIRIFGGGAAGAGALTGSGTLTGTLELGDQNVWIRGGPIVLNGRVTGSGRLAFDNNVLTLGGANNDFTGPVLWDPDSFSTLRLAVSNALPAGVAINLTSVSHFLDLTGKSQTIASLEGKGRVDLGVGSGVLTITAPTDAIFTGMIEGNGTVNQTGGSLTLTGINLFNGSYNLAGGTLLLNGGAFNTLKQTGGTLHISNGAIARKVTVNGGTLEPVGGSAVPRIDSLTLASGAIYSAVIDATDSTKVGVLEASDDIDFGGSTLRISGNVTGLTRFLRFTLIGTNNSSLSLSGQFAGAAPNVPFPGPGGFDYAVGYNSFSAFPLTLDVLGKPTTTTLTSSDNPSVAGDEVTFTATVFSPAGVPTGDVRFKDGFDDFASAPLDAAGKGTVSTKTLATGSHPIQAVYDGTDILAESASSKLDFVVLETAPAPAIVFDADPPIVVIGHSSTLVWTTTFATSVTIDHGIGAQSLSGSLPVQPPATTTYMLTATGPGGTTVRQVTVTVATNGIIFTAVPDTILLRDSAVLAWAAPDATSITIDHGIGTVAAEGQRSVSPALTTTYVLTATGPAGTKTASATVTVTPQPPRRRSVRH
ncbi:MAG TPA: Ig-like domain repeat protein [Thermoanaerobaculia bacterium]|nr:Ig-like domain repeat protein [Thermoanaerobaculia bacterium]